MIVPARGTLPNSILPYFPPATLQFFDADSIGIRLLKVPGRGICRASTLDGSFPIALNSHL